MRRTYWQGRACVQLAAPEGFSAIDTDPALTIPGLADSSKPTYSFPSSLFKTSELSHETLKKSTANKCRQSDKPEISLDFFLCDATIFIYRLVV
jgi:hypothetical protein